jgi:phage head maturation protease
MPWSIVKRDDQFCVVKDDDGETEGCHDTREKAERQMKALYASENRAEEPEKRAPIESRAATVEDVNYPERLIDVLAVPYEQEAIIEYRGELWRETIERGAFDGVEKRPNRIKAFRSHEDGPHLSGTGRSGLIGRVVSFSPEREEGLMGSVKIAKTPLGDETLTLANEGILGVSVGFGVRGRDQVFNRVERTRRIRRAFVDHIAFPDNGAYEGAQVIDVRSGKSRVADDLPRLDTPRIDEVIAWMESRRGRG